MGQGVTITVGHEGAGLVGDDNRALQGAVDYVASLGGGVVLIDGATRDLLLEDCIIGDTRPAGSKAQAVGLSVGSAAGPVTLRRVDLAGNARAEVECEAGEGAILRQA